MKILITNTEVAVILANWTDLDRAGIEFDKKVRDLLGTRFSDEVKAFVKKSNEEKMAKVMYFLTTPGSEIKRGPVTITEVKKGIVITVEPNYVSEFMEIYLTSIIPMFGPMYDLVVASKNMTDKLKALDKKFATK